MNSNQILRQVEYKIAPKWRFNNETEGWCCIRKRSLDNQWSCSHVTSYHREMNKQKIVPLPDSTTVVLFEKGVSCVVMLHLLEEVELDYKEMHVVEGVMGEGKAQSQIIGAKLFIKNAKVWRPSFISPYIVDEEKNATDSMSASPSPLRGEGEESLVHEEELKELVDRHQDNVRDKQVGQYKIILAPNKTAEPIDFCVTVTQDGRISFAEVLNLFPRD
jgi:hypothetical protein